MPESFWIPTERLLLRDFATKDVADAREIVGDDRVTISLSFQSKDQLETERMISDAISSSLVAPRKEYYLAIEEQASTKMVGFIRLAVNGSHSAKIGYAVRFDRWGAGLATEAASAVCQFAFSNLKRHRITAATAPDNDASSAVLKNLGFVQEGRLRDHVYTNGAWRDSLLYSLLRQDFSGGASSRR